MPKVVPHMCIYLYTPTCVKTYTRPVQTGTILQEWGGLLFGILTSRLHIVVVFLNQFYKMKTATRFLLLLGLGTIAVCENTFETVVLRAACGLKYRDVQRSLNCTRSLAGIIHHNEAANAKATLVCQDVMFIVLAHDSGTFVIERRSSENGPWSDAVVSNMSKVSLPWLLAETPYQFRLFRVYEDGVSNPENTGWFKTMADVYEPMKVPSISPPKFELDPQDPLHMRGEIRFTPADDRICFYDVLRQDRKNNNILIQLDKPVEFNVTFVKFELGTEYIVSITARTKREISSDRTEMIFTTPSCLELYQNLTICKPDKVEGLNATTNHKMGNIFDVIVTWKRPKLIPDYYELWLFRNDEDSEDPERRNVSGILTETVFSNVKIVQEFEVRIRARSKAGPGPTIFESFMTPNGTHLPIERPTAPDIGTIVMAFLASCVLVFGTGIYAYHRHEKRKRSQERLKYFQGLEEKQVAFEAIKDVPDPDPITVEKSLLAPVQDEYEINPDRLEIKRILGSGAFGVVKLGSLCDDRGQVTAVAVKMLRDEPNEEDLRSFELEIKVMKSAGQHPNIVSLLGCCTIGPRPLLIVEYCSRGDLQSFLRAILEKATVSIIEAKRLCESNSRSSGRRENLEDDSEESSSASDSSKDDEQISSFVANRAYDIDRDAFCNNEMVTVTDLLNFGRQIATGMEFLSSNRVVHRDLAARNVLVCEDRTVKISDFGLSRDIYQENVYKKQGNGRVPVKWMAIEALTHQVYSTYSDVWSFGILLWEIVTLGSSPYPDIPANGVLKQLRSGYRMERPANCSVPLYNVMLSCWQTKPRDRPTFTVLRQELDKLLYVAAENEYLDLNNVSRGTPPGDEDSQTMSSRYTYFPTQLRYVNDHEPHVMDEDCDK